MESDQTLVNGNLVKKYIGQTVRMYLKVENISSGGRQLSGLTTDKKTIGLKLEQPLNQPLSGFIEVFGTVENQNTLNCSEIIVFPNDENTEPFDEESHNAIVLAMDNMRDFYEFGDE